MYKNYLSYCLKQFHLFYLNDILNQPYKEEIAQIAQNNITIGVCEKEFLEELSKYDAIFKIHIEILNIKFMQYQ